MTKPVRFSIKWKIFLTIAFLITSALLVVLLRTSQIFREDKENFVKEQSGRLASTNAKAIDNLITDFQDKLIIFISSKESLSHTGAKVGDQIKVLFSRYQRFLSIGLEKESDQGVLEPEWFLRNPDGESNNWPKDLEKELLEHANLKRVGKNGRVIWRFQTPEKQNILGLGFVVEIPDIKTHLSTKAWVVGLLPENIFNDLFKDFATGLDTGFLIDDEGLVIGGSNIQYRWQNLSRHPVVEEALKNRGPSGAGDFTDLDGRQIIGSFNAVPAVNLTAVVTTPRDKAFEAAEDMTRNIIFIGVIILVLALATAILLSNYMTAPLSRLASLTSKIGAGEFHVDLEVTTNDEIGDLTQSFKKMGQGLLDRDEALSQAQSALIQSEKMGAFGQISAGIAHEVKNPLAGILGHAQLAIGKAESPEIKKHLEVIEKETRRCKQIVENLMKFARQEKADLISTDLGQVVQDTINLVDHQLSLSGCKIFKDLKPCPMVFANANQLQQVLLNLMVNASHAMEKSERKDVTVRVLQVGKKAQIQIEDTGSGISPEIQKKIFEPFFTTKPAGKGTGLGLSVSIGIVKDHKGEISLKSEIGKGTTFLIDIPIPDGAKMPEKMIEPALTVASVSNPSANPNPNLNAIPIPIRNPIKTEPVATVPSPAPEFPDFPEDDTGITTFFTNTEIAKVGTKTETTITKKISDSDFKVKINRPKLKS
jgi:signal transduction histidine kinase